MSEFFSNLVWWEWLVLVACIWPALGFLIWLAMIPSLFRVAGILNVLFWFIPHILMGPLSIVFYTYVVG